MPVKKLSYARRGSCFVMGKENATYKAVIFMMPPMLVSCIPKNNAIQKGGFIS